MVVVVAQQSRPAGTYTGEFATPAGAHSLTATVLMSTATRADAANTMSFLVEGTNDPASVPEASATWNIQGGGDWQGGTDPKRGGTMDPPTLRLYNSAGLYPRLRARAVTNRTYSWGVDVVSS